MTLALALLLAIRPLWTDAPAAKERPTAPPISIAALVKSSMPAVVGIVATTARGGANDPFREFLERMYGQGGAGPSESPVRGIGTGFFIRSDGLIATNGHVIEGATDITVQVGEEERVYRATLVGQDDATDLALLKVEGSAPFPVLPLGESDHLEVGEWVVAIGNPFGLSRSVTTGIVSFKGRRDVNPTGRPGYYDMIQTDAAINPGNSGGPLLDSHGAVIGINTAIYGPQGNIGLGFAMPVNRAKAMLEEFQAKGRIARPWLGLSVFPVSGNVADALGLPSEGGLLIQRVERGSPAAEAGLRGARQEVIVFGSYRLGAGGDMIVAIDGKPPDSNDSLRKVLDRKRAGDMIEFSIYRDGRTQKIRVKLGEAPQTL